MTDVIDWLCTQLSSDQMNEMNGDCNDDTDLNENADDEINLNETALNGDDDNDDDDDENVINVDDAAKFNKCENFDENDSFSDPSSKDERSVAASTLIAEQQEDK